jgi:glucokinase
MANTEPVLVFDIGGTKVACALFLPPGSPSLGNLAYDSAPDGVCTGLSSGGAPKGETLPGTLLCRAEIETQAADGPEAVAERIVALGQRVLAEAAVAHPELPAPAAAGVASAGQIDLAKGTVSYATFHLPGWIGFPLGQRLAGGLRMHVWVDNDVNCHALAEARLGAGRPYRHFLLAAVGTGVGGGVVIDGQVYRGRLGGAGEIGQVCVEPHGGRPCSGELNGCLEVYAASSVMVAESGYLSIGQLGEAYRGGAEIPAVERAAAYLGRGLAIIVHILAPEAILIGGSGGLLGPRYLAAVQQSLEHHSLASHKAIPLHFTQLAADSGLIGAGLVACELSS